METNELISAYHFCANHQIEPSFIDALGQYGLVEITTIESKSYVKESQLGEVERFMRLHYDLDINFEGMEAITHLLQKLETMQARILELQNRLGLYENKPAAY